MDLAFVEEFDNIRSILQYVQAGQEGGNAFADVVSGDVTPSGKMTDTWAKKITMIIRVQRFTATRAATS